MPLLQPQVEKSARQSSEVSAADRMVEATLDVYLELVNQTESHR